jgi:uncharacterized protein (DUF983 family)
VWGGKTPPRRTSTLGDADRQGACRPRAQHEGGGEGDDVNESVSSDATKVELPRAIWRGFLRRCPRCGQGALFKAYLKQVDACAVCHEEYAHIRADDAPPWLTILVVGHIVVPLIFVVDSGFSWPNWLVMIVWPAITVLLALAVLPRAKGVFIALIWATRAPGSERG